MGKNVLKFPGVVLRNSATILWLLACVIVSVGATSVNDEDVRNKMVDGIYMPRIPHSSQWNISQTEYETKHREYFDLVEQNQRRRLNSPLSYYDGENIVKKKLYTFTHLGLRNLPASTYGIKNFIYDIYIPEESYKNVEVEEISLRLLIVPKSCATDNQAVTLTVVNTGSNYPLKKENFILKECLPKWVGLDLTNDGFYLNLKSNFKVTIRCDECLGQNVELQDPYLNVIVNVKNRIRRRRAERKKRRRFQGKCERHTWELEFGKLTGYEYIIQPKKFDAGLCAGKCSSHWNLATQHSNLQYLFSTIDKSVPKPCCAPIKMADLEVLHPDEHNPKKLKLTIWNNTKIVDCACS